MKEKKNFLIDSLARMAMAYSDMTAGFEAVDQEFGGRHKPVKPVAGVWKITSLELLNEQRL